MKTYPLFPEPPKREPSAKAPSLKDLPRSNPSEQAPYQRHSETSREAASLIAGTPAAAARSKVYQFLLIQAHRGATDEEIIEATGLSASTARPRRVELVQSGLVVETNMRRPTASGRTATVWRAK